MNMSLPRAHQLNHRRWTVRGAGSLIAAAGLVALSAGVASAHVRVVGSDVSQGGEGVLTFRVPTESDTASTTRVTVSFPQKTPIAEAAVQPVPGWTAVVKTAKPKQPIQTDDGPVDSYVSTVTWTADSAASAIKPGQFQQFPLSVGPLPDTPTVDFPTIQHYSDGTDVAWIETAPAGAAEPEHPVPELVLPAADDQGAPTPTGGASASLSPAPSSTDSTDSTSSGNGSGSDQAADAGDGGTTWPGWVGLVAGVLALVVAGGALARSGRRSTPTS